MIFVLPIIALLFGGSYAAYSVGEPSLCYKNCTSGVKGQTIIRQFEGYMPTVYKDVGGKNTICYGHLVKPGERFNTPMTPAECQTLLESDLRLFERKINANQLRPYQDDQFNAVTSFNFNLGWKPSFMKKVNEDKIVTDDFLRYNHVGKKVVKSLTIRRLAEANLYSAD